MRATKRKLGSGKGAGGVLTYAGCVEGLQAVQGWGTMGRGAGGRPWLVH